jgi:hypothetical protein
MKELAVMASIRETATGRRVPLEPEHVVGRSLTCALRLVPQYVSAQQTQLRWTGSSWYVRDLGSSNGTFLDGARIASGEEYPVQRGSRVAFGDLEAEWELVDDGPPHVMAIPLDEGAPQIMEGELLALPSAEDPHGTIYRGGTGGWVLEQLDGSIIALDHFVVFTCAGRVWRFCCAETMGRTVRGAVFSTELQLRSLELTFRVSLDEEHVSIQARGDGRSIEIGERAHNYLLLTLARRLLEDKEGGFPDTSCGWIDREELAKDPRMASPQVNLDVYRIRKQFAVKGVVDAAAIVERRPRELRIGTDKITIVRV